MLKKAWNKFKNRSGYTLMEVMAVVAILAIICTIAIPSMFNIQKNLKVQEKDDYAKTIYMAAQSNLLDLRSSNQLSALSALPDVVPAKEGYAYVSSRNTSHSDAFNLVLPLNSVESTLRDQEIIIELNPSTGSVLSVFYADTTSKLEDTLESTYLSDATLRSEETRKDLLVGYYYGSDLDTSELEIVDLEAQLYYDNGEEGILYVDVPLQTPAGVNIFEGQYSRFMEGLEVKLSLWSDHGSMEQIIKAYGNDSNCIAAPGAGGVMMIRMSYPLDSLRSGESFALRSYNNGKDALNQIADPKACADESGFTILPGENLSAMAEVTYTSTKDDPLVDVRSAALAGINPLFDSMTTNEAGKYVLAISNGRHLQNLNLLAPSVAQNVAEVVFVADKAELQKAEDAKKADPTAEVNTEIIIDWKDTVTHYGGAVTTFTPINHGVLFAEYSVSDGTNTTEVYPSTVIKGNDCKIYNLKIDTSAVTEGSSYYAANTDYGYTGLFGYLNAKVENLNLVNPTVKGNEQSTATATGALVGAAGSKAKFINCGVYLDTEVEGFDRENHGFGVSGKGAVGGMVGYSQSDVELGEFDLSKAAVVLKPESKDPLEENQVDEKELLNYVSFYKSFAAVPVTGDMTGSTLSGVGGMVGQTQNSNFYGCYASGEVTATGCAAVPAVTNVDMGFKYGAGSKAVGGFVGNSYGSCYSNCFASGNVNADAEAAGGFVGLMHYNGTIENQHTVFSSCYSVGTTTVADSSKANFSGLCGGSMDENLYSANYYDLLAPQFITGETLNYQSPYIYKDSFYLDQTMSNNEDFCASAISYSELKTLHTMDAASRLEQQKNKKLFDVTISADVLQALDRAEDPAEKQDVVEAMLGGASSAAHNFLRTGSYESLITYLGIDTKEIQNLPEGTTKIYPVHFNIYWSGEATGLKEAYTDAYKKAFDASVWGECEETFPYEFYAYEAEYPFSMLTGMDYYGDWPTMTPAVGLAYYEKYDDGSVEGSYGFYFDKQQSSTLNGTLPVLDDGYALLAVNPLTIEELDVDVAEPIPVNIGSGDSAKSYYAYLITTTPDADGKDFYTAVELTTSHIDADNKEVETNYTFYYNPLVALSHINPTDGGTTAEKATNVPEQIYIRTARHFYNIGAAMTKYWNRDYVQQRDIDFSTYEGARGAVLSPIGSEGNPFTGTYDGSGNRIVVTDEAFPTSDKYSGLFGRLAQKKHESSEITLIGTVKNLEIEPVPTPKPDDAGKSVQKYPVKLSVSDSNSFGLAVAYNDNGIIDGVKVVLNGDVEIMPASNAEATSTNVGLLVGTNAGQLINSTVLVPEAVEEDEDAVIAEDDKDEDNSGVTVTIAAIRAGGLVGLNEGAVISDCAVTAGQGASLTLLADNCLSVGGLIGMSAENTENKGGKVKQCMVDANIEIDSDGALYAGGLVGYTLNTEFDGNTADGAILMKDFDENKTAVIGGAVGYSVNGTYKGNASTVALDPNWAECSPWNGSATLEGVEDLNPSTFGSVGKFVGHIDEGIFNDCSAENKDKTNYQFLGTIKAAEAHGPAPASHYSYEDLGETPAVSDELAGKMYELPTSANPTAAPAPRVFNFNGIALTDCSFDMGESGPYHQLLSGIYYYKLGANSVSKEIGATFTEIKLELEKLTATDWEDTGYFYLEKAGEGKDDRDIYHKVYSMLEDGTVKFAIKAEQNESGEGSADTTTPPEGDSTENPDAGSGDENSGQTDGEAGGENAGETGGDNSGGAADTPTEDENIYEDISHELTCADDKVALYQLTIPAGKYLLVSVDEGENPQRKPLSAGKDEVSGGDFNVYAGNENYIWTVNGTTAANGSVEHTISPFMMDEYMTDGEELWMRVANKGPHTLHPIVSSYQRLGSAQICAVYLGGLHVQSLPGTVTDSEVMP